MNRYILDTNLFFNMEAGLGLGEKTEAVVRNMTQIIWSSKEEFLLPPRVVEEFLSFFDDKNQGFIKDFLGQVIIKSPDISKVSFPGTVFYQLVEDVRNRSYRGLRIGEEELVKIAQLMMGKNNLNKKDFQIQTGEGIKKFRERYRQATRFGFLDSLADLDLIVLAKEVDGFLVTSDEGVMVWGRIFGVKELPVSVFGEKMRGFLVPHHQE